MRSKSATACRRLRLRRDYCTIGVDSLSLETPYPPVKTPAEVKGCRERLVDFAALRASRTSLFPRGMASLRAPIGGAAAGLGTGTTVSPH